MLGLATPETQTSAQVVSPQGQAIADGLIRYSKQVKQIPILRGVRYDGIAFAEARARASSLVAQAAQAVGATTMDPADLKQLLIGGANLMYTLGLNVRATSYFEGAQYRTYEQRVQAFAQDFMVQMVELTQVGRGSLSGLRAAGDAAPMTVGIFFPLVGAALILMTAFLRALDTGEGLARELCSQDPDSAACLRALAAYNENIKNPADPFSPARDITGAIGSVIKWVGVGAAVLGAGYLLWVFGPLLIGGGTRVRDASKRRLARRST